MVERLLIVLIFSVLMVGFYCFSVRRQLYRLSNLTPAQDAVLSRLQPGIPAIVYFTTPNCIPCKTQQQPALAELATELGQEIQIVQVDATQEMEVADLWGVMSAPTTFVVDSQGKTRSVNHGVATSNKLKQQLNAIVI